MFSSLNDIAYVSYDGNYGERADLLVFDTAKLTIDQWDNLSILGDNSRFEYVQAIFAGKDLSEWEQ
jgi:hypothetical protein